MSSLDSRALVPCVMRGRLHLALRSSALTRPPTLKTLIPFSPTPSAWSVYLSVPEDATGPEAEAGTLGSLVQDLLLVSDA